MRSMIFDAGPIISLATNNLLWILDPLKKKFKGEFYITDAVKRELVDVPLETKKFKFEAIQVQKLIEDGVIKIYDDSTIKEKATGLLEFANHVFRAFDNYMKIIHYAEMSVLAAAMSLKSDAVVIDEKTTRLLMEEPNVMLNIMKKNMHSSIGLNESNLKQFRNSTKDIHTIRSVELVTVAYEQKLLDGFVTDIPDARKNLLESVLWGVKLNGCAVTREELERIIKLEPK